MSIMNSGKDIAVALHSSSSKLPFAIRTSHTSLSTHTNTFQTEFSSRGHTELLFRSIFLQYNGISVSIEWRSCRDRHPFH